MKFKGNRKPHKEGTEKVYIELETSSGNAVLLQFVMGLSDEVRYS